MYCSCQKSLNACLSNANRNLRNQFKTQLTELKVARIVQHAEMKIEIYETSFRPAKNYGIE